MGVAGWLQSLRRRLGGRPPLPPPLVAPGVRVRLRNPLATSHKVWVPAGAAGIVVGWDTPGRRVSVELDAPRTVVTVPWSWIEAEPPPAVDSVPSAD
ncbi:MAG TPA: hypothetical protein VGX21_10170 [Methylomirabilota bacterium]|jgi:hypothetical protein|nr:hypothetical protein [Methylomirabilota bacterium]